MAEKRVQTIQEIHATLQKRKVDDADEASTAGEVTELDMTRKASRSRCTAAIEKNAEEVALSNAMLEKFFTQQSERNDFKESRNASISAIDEQEVLRRSKQATKAELDLLVFQKDHGLISEEQFLSQANRLLAK